IQGLLGVKLKKQPGFCKGVLLLLHPDPRSGWKIHPKVSKKCHNSSGPGGGMRGAAPQSLRSRFSIVIVTTDESVRPEAEAYLAADYDVRVLPTWDELIRLIKKQPPEAVLIDVDIIGQRPDEGV